jgi:hypothetical protein
LIFHHLFNPRNIQLKNNWELNLTPEDQLTWIKNDHRQALWINLHIPKLFSTPSTKKDAYINPPTHLRGRNLSIAIIDHLTTHHLQETKKLTSHIKQLGMQWEKRVEMDRVFDWFKESKPEEKIDFFWKWLKKHETIAKEQQLKFNNYEELLIFFDHLPISENEKKYLIQNSRKTWDQKERRENQKDKKQCNLTLSAQTIKKLDALKTKHRMSRSEIIEAIINGELA